MMVTWGPRKASGLYDHFFAIAAVDYVVCTTRDRDLHGHMYSAISRNTILGPTSMVTCTTFDSILLGVDAPERSDLIELQSSLEPLAASTLTRRHWTRVEGLKQSYCNTSYRMLYS